MIYFVIKTCQACIMGGGVTVILKDLNFYNNRMFEVSITWGLRAE